MFKTKEQIKKEADKSIITLISITMVILVCVLINNVEIILK